MFTILYPLSFVFVLVHGVHSNDKDFCRIVEKDGITSKGYIEFQVQERSPKGEYVGKFHLRHDASVRIENLQLTFQGNVSYYFSFVKYPISSGRTDIRVFVEKPVDLSKELNVVPTSGMILDSVKCLPNSIYGSQFVIKFQDINDPQEFNLPSVTYNLKENFPIQNQFHLISKSLPRIFAWDKDPLGFSLGHNVLHFYVAEDLSLRKESHNFLIISELSPGPFMNYSINLVLKKKLNYAKKREHKIYISSEDASDRYIRVTLPVKINVEPVGNVN